MKGTLTNKKHKKMNKIQRYDYIYSCDHDYECNCAEHGESNTGKWVLYKDHIAAMNTCVKCGQPVTNWDDHIMTCEKSPAVMRIKELERELERCLQDLQEEINNRS